MEITYAARSIIPSRQANSIHVVKMVAAMQKQGHNIDLIVPNRKDKMEEDVPDIFKFYGVDSFPIKYFPWVNFTGSTYIYCLVVSIAILFSKKDLVYTRDIYTAIFTTLFGLPTVMEYHVPPNQGNGIKGWLFKKCFCSPNLIGLVVISDALKKIFIDYGFNEEQLFVAHDGSDPMPADTKLFGLKGKIKVGYIGHLYKGRGIENIIYLAKKNADIYFHIAGGTENNISYWEQKTDSSQNNIIFHGFIAPRLTDAFRKECDILVAPYQKELEISKGTQNTAPYMSPLKIFEYMAAGKPIICSDLPVLREVLNKDNAILCDPNDLEEWNRSVKKLATNKNLQIDLGNKALSSFKNKFSWDKRAKRILCWAQIRLNNMR